MATEKLAEGIRKFYADARKLEQYAQARVTQKMSSVENRDIDQRSQPCNSE